MNSEKLFDLFVTFLKVNNAYENYINNFKRQGFSNSGAASTMKNFSNISIYRWISVFTWTSSIEGFRYWKNLQDKWDHLVKLLEVPRNTTYKYPHPIDDKPKD